MELKEFKQQHTSTKRNVKITNSIGVYDIYKHIRRNHWYNIGRPLKEHEFYTIIRSVNKLLAEELVLGHTVKFPEKMGCLELRKYEVGAFMKDGKLKITYPIDWGETWKLWFNDAEAHKQKTLLRHESPYHYTIKYLKDQAAYENKIFYQFKLNQKLKKQLSKNIKNGITDTLYG